MNEAELAQLEICEQAEREMVALEMTLHEYRALAAKVIQSLRERQHADGLAGRMIHAKRRRVENSRIAALHAHDAAVMSALLGQQETRHAS